MEAPSFDHQRLYLVQILQAKERPTFEDILHRIERLPEIPDELENILTARMERDGEKGYRQIYIPPHLLAPGLYWKSLGGRSLCLVKVDGSNYRSGFLRVESKHEAAFSLDDPLDSSRVFENGKSLLITHSDTDFVQEDVVSYLTKELLTMAEPFAGDGRTLPTHIEKITSNKVVARLGAEGMWDEMLSTFGFRLASKRSKRFHCSYKAEKEKIKLAANLSDLRIPFQRKGLNKGPKVLLDQLYKEGFLRTKPLGIVLEGEDCWHISTLSTTSIPEEYLAGSSSD